MTVTESIFYVSAPSLSAVTLSEVTIEKAPVEKVKSFNFS